MNMVEQNDRSNARDCRYQPALLASFSNLRGPKLVPKSGPQNGTTLKDKLIRQPQKWGHILTPELGA